MILLIKIIKIFLQLCLKPDIQDGIRILFHQQLEW